jgi:hypothetical protein
MTKRPPDPERDARYAAEKREAQLRIDEVGRAARVLAANLLKMVVDAGEDGQARKQAAAFIEAYDRLAPIAGSGAYPYPPSAAVATGLRRSEPHDPDDVQRRLEDGSWAATAAENALIDAALRVAAARLAGQSTVGKYTHRLYAAARELGEAQAEQNRKMDERRRSRPPEESLAEARSFAERLRRIKR